MKNRPLTVFAFLCACSLVALSPSVAFSFSGFSSERDGSREQTRGYIAVDCTEDEAVKAQLLELRTENRKLAQSLADASNRALSLGAKEDNLREQNRQDREALEKMLAERDSLKTENAALMQQVAESSAGEAMKKLRQDVERLQSQNYELRKTVADQNNVIEKVKKPDEEVAYLRTEIRALKEKLAMGNIRTETDREQQLSQENKALKEGIEKRDEFIKRMEILKVAAQALKAENEKLAQELEMARNSALPVDAVQPSLPVGSQTVVVGDQSPSRDVRAEDQEMMVAYRKKIREYQEEIARLKEGNVAVLANGVETAAGSDDAAQATERQMAALLLENQDLRARLNLLSSQMAGTDDSGAVLPAVNVVSADAQVDRGGTVPSVQAGGDGKVVYKMPRESLEMLKARGVLK